MSPTYEVTFHERLIVTERVEAANATEAREKVLGGEGERVDETFDGSKGPTTLRARRLR